MPIGQAFLVLTYLELVFLTHAWMAAEMNRVLGHTGYSKLLKITNVSYGIPSK